MPDNTTVTGLGESNLGIVKVGEVVQFERFGFCCLDSINEEKGKKKYLFWFTHK